MKLPVETEIKLAIPAIAAARTQLRKAGFRVRARRVFEQNIVLDDNARSLRDRGLLLRVRAAGDRITCTFKGPMLPGRHKRRTESEFVASDLLSCLALFGGLGFGESFRYEKFRTEFERPGEPGHIVLDETPIGAFLELEGPARWIDRTAAELGFAREAAITTSYASLYRAWCAEYGGPLQAMRFSKKL